jgi:hypothetical protein
MAGNSKQYVPTLKLVKTLQYRELCSTIDPLQNGDYAYIYSKNQQQQKQDAALRALRLQVF